MAPLLSEDSPFPQPVWSLDKSKKKAIAPAGNQTTIPELSVPQLIHQYDYTVLRALVQEKETTTGQGEVMVLLFVYNTREPAVQTTCITCLFEKLPNEIGTRNYTVYMKKELLQTNKYTRINTTIYNHSHIMHSEVQIRHILTRTHTVTSIER